MSHLLTFAYAAVHNAYHGNGGAYAKFHIGLAIYVLVKDETGTLAVQVKA